MSKKAKKKKRRGSSAKHSPKHIGKMLTTHAVPMCATPDSVSEMANRVGAEVGISALSGVATEGAKSLLGLGFLSNTISHSRQLITENRDIGVDCPTCDRKVKAHRFLMGQSMALMLETMYAQHQDNWCNTRNLRTEDDTAFADTNHVVSKMAHWRLVKQHHDSKKIGSWAVTDLGARWIKGEEEIPEEIKTYQGEIISQSEELISFQEAVAMLPRKATKDRTHVTAASSDRMFRDKTLVARRSKIYQGTAGDLFGELTSDHPESHDSRVYRGDQIVGSAREWFYDNLKEGVYCPTCDRFATYQKYGLSDSLARLMIEIYHRRNTRSPIRTSTFELNKRIVDRTGQAYMLVRRELLAQVPTPQGESGTSWCEITPEGEKWVENRSDTTAKLTSYNRYDKGSGDESDERVTVSQVLAGSKNWTYEGLMSRIESNDEDEAVPTDEDLFPLDVYEFLGDESSI